MIRRPQFVFLIVIFLIITVLTSIQMYQMVNLFFLLLCSFLLVIDRRLLILIYIILLPTNGFISTEHNLLGIFHVSYIVNTFVTLAVILEWKLIPKGIKNQIKIRHNHKKYASLLIIFVLLYLILTDIRLLYFGMKDIEESHKILISPIKYFMMFFPLLILIRLSETQKYEFILKRGFVIGANLIALTIVFSEYITQLGFASQDIDLFLNGVEQQGLVRRAGIFTSMGDVNSAAGYLAVFFCYILFFGSHYKNSIKITSLTLTALAIISTGSRTGLISLLFIITVFFLTRELSNRKKTQYVIFLIILAFVFFTFDVFNPILERFGRLKTGEDAALDPDSFSRIGGWLVYLNYIFSDIRITLLGTTQSIFESFFNYKHERVAHNFFIQLWYYWGIIPLIFLFASFFRFIKSAFHSYKRYGFLTLFFTSFLTLFMVSDIGVLLAFILSLIAIESNPQKSFYVNK